MEYLSLPLALRNGYFAKTDLYGSLAGSVGLILGTRKGSLPCDPEFGCDLWEKEFSDLFTSNRSEVQGSIRNAINRGEPRLFDVSVAMIKIQTSPNHPLGIAVKVTGNYRDGNDEKRFEESYNIG